MPVLVSEDQWVTICMENGSLCQLLKMVNVTDVLQKLFALKYVTKDQRREFSEIIRNSFKNEEKFQRENANWTVLHKLAYRITFKQFLEALFKAKYHEITFRLQQECRQGVLRFSTRNIETGPNFKRAQKLYMNTKVKTHQNIFRNPTEVCKQFYDQNKIKFRECEVRLSDTDITEVERVNLKTEAMGNATLCVSHLFAALDAEITRWNADFTWQCPVSSPKSNLEELFNELYYYIDKTENPKITEVGFYSRIAIAFAMTGQLARADEYIELAYFSSLFIPNSAELEFMLHMYVMILLFKYQKDPTQWALDKLSHIAEIGLRTLQDETDDSVRYFWMRMIILRKVFALIGLSNSVEVIQDCHCSAEGVNMAEELLVHVNSFGQMESRREMFFYTAKARVAELRNEPCDAIEYIELAICCDELGCFGETENVRKYSNRLKQRLKEVDERGDDTTSENIIPQN